MGVDETILQLIDQGDIGDQATLRERLRDKGHVLTQPTLSRHLKRLNVRKERGRYRYVERPNVGVPDFRLIPIEPNLIVLRTHPGYAQALAVKLDSDNVPGIAGTIAGDDTVLIAAQDDNLQLVCDRIRNALDTSARSH